MVEKDILDFLDSKFAKLKKKKSTKKPAKNSTELLDALQAQADAKPSLSTQNLYQALISDAELNIASKESGGVKAFQTFHLAKPSMYETHVKDKVFFIGQNAV